MIEDAPAPWRVVTPDDEIDMYSAPHLRQELLKGVAAGQRGIVLDLTSVAFVDSSGFAVIVSALKRLQAAGADLRVCGPATAVRSAMRISGIDGILAVYPDLPAALAQDVADRDADAQ